MPLSADPAGLGRLAVISALGEPFHAEIDLISEGERDLPSLTARLASPETYRQLDLPYGPAQAGLRVTVERRPTGQPYIKVTSARYINEPFVTLLVELDMPSGRLLRNYTALLDPPPLGAPALRQPAADIAAPVVRPAPLAPTPAVAPPDATRSYGPIRLGETLGKIARELKPEGVSLVQMIIGLFRGNPSAFIRENLNLVKAGETLRVPAKEEVAATPHSEAVKEYRDQVAAWTAYRERLAAAAETPPAPEEARDVARVSKSAPPRDAGLPGSLDERARILEEEAIAGEKALRDAQDRIVQLEKTIKDLQLLAKRQDAVTTPEPVTAKPEVTPETAPVEAITGTPKLEPGAGVPAAAPAPKVKPSAPRPEVATPAPQPESDLMDDLMANLPLVGGGAAVVLLGAGLWFARRRRLKGAVDGTGAPVVGAGKAVEPVYAKRPGQEPAAAAAEQMDPLEEAKIFITYGREAQAAQLLEDAVAEKPSREDVWLKLFEIYAARKDKNAFGKRAQIFHDLTGGKGENWLKVAAMGFTLEPGNALYEAGRGTVESVIPAEPDVSDFAFDREAPAPAADRELAGDDTIVEPIASKAIADAESGSTVDLEMVAPPAGETITDISFDMPDSGTPSTDLELDADEGKPKSADDAPMIDFNIELPKADESPEEQATAEPPAGEDKDADSERKFALDLSGINLELDDAQKAESAPGADEKDPHWHDVQEKFELVKAYQILGAETESVLEILQDIVKEGDAQQRTEAKKLIDGLTKGDK